MIEGFDKEMDSLLRQAAAGEIVQTLDAQHLDADEIALFAENALPVKARTRAVEHLAECAKCRKILSHLISFNAAEESESAHATEENSVTTVAPIVPWYRQFFAFPQLTYAMGALALVFAGVIAFVVLQQQSNSFNSSTVAQKEIYSEKSRGTGGASSDGETASTYSSNAANTASVSATPFVSSNATTANANTTTNSMISSSNSAANAAPREQMPATMQTPSNSAVRSEPRDNFTLGTQNQPPPAPAPSSPTVVTDGVSAPEIKDANEKNKSGDVAKTERRDAQVREEERKRQGESPSDDRSTMSAQSTMMRKAAKPQQSGDTRSVGRKTFRNVGGIWFDAAYGSQQQTMIRRGSEDYRKLDSGLRSIAENLSGTVVVLWKGRAYQIN